MKEISRVFISLEDIMSLFGCGRSTAYTIVRKVNTYANKKGELIPPTGKINKYTFAELYGIPIEDINEIINSKQDSD